VVTLAGFWVAEEYAELLDEQAEGGRLPGMAAHPNATVSKPGRLPAPASWRLQGAETVDCLHTHIQGSSCALQRACLVWIPT
jgi:hypothetical protein